MFQKNRRSAARWIAPILALSALTSVGCGSGADSGGAGTDGSTSGAAESTGVVVELTSGGGGGPSGSAAGDACVDVSVPLDGVPPTVVLLVDQSVSMNDTFGKGTRWTVLRDALMDPKSGVVARVQDRVKFGLALYSSKNGTQDGAKCPILHEVTATIANYQAIESVYGPARPYQDTPTGDSIKAIAAELAALPAGPKYILLVTDGLPDTCSDPNPANNKAQAAANDYTVKAAQAAYAQGIGIIMMGVSSDIAPQHLQDMANAGAGKPLGGTDNAKYYVASSDQAALAAQLLEAVGTAQSCVFDLNGTVDASAVSRGVVSLCENEGGCASDSDREVLGYNDPNGWTLANPSQVELTGTACMSVKSGIASDFQARFPCGVFHPRVN